MAKIYCKATVSCLMHYRDKLVMVYEEQAGRATWDIPAGGIEDNETPEQAIRRELREEVGVCLTDQPLTLVHVFWVMTDMPTIHFLFKTSLQQNTRPALLPKAAEIQDVRLFSRPELQELIDTRAYEHELAKVRLLLFLQQLVPESTTVKVIP